MGCQGCVKYLLFIFNFALWLLGCALLAVGVWMKMDDRAEHYVQRMTEKEDEKFQISYSATGGTDMTVTIAYVLIVFGLVLIAVTFIGCCGAVRENTFFLGLFAACLAAMFIALVSVGIWASVKKWDVDAHTEELRAKTDASVEKAVGMYYTDDSSKEFMDTIQDKFHCCGAKLAERDYNRRVPASCESSHLGRRCTVRYFIFVGKEIEEFLRHRYTIIAGVALAVAVCLAGGIAITMLMCCMLRRSSSHRVS